MNSARFAQGQRWDQYLESMATNRVLMQRKVDEFQLDDPARFLDSPIAAVLAFTEDWCQDSVTAFPPLIAVARVAQLNLRVLRRSQALALQQSLTAIEYPPIPTFLFYDQGWRERGRFLEMPRAFRQLLDIPAEAMWLREMYDDLWWQAEVEELAAIFATP